MTHSRTSASASDSQVPAAASRPRRRFLQLASASAGTLALQACGGGGGMTAATAQAGAPEPAALPPSTASGGTLPSALVPPSSPPVWSLVPALSFTQGVPSTISISKYVKSSSGGPLAIALNGIVLPAGVTYNARTLSFVYDGIGAAATTSGHVLTASTL